jgi:hypothetical protein
MPIRNGNSAAVSPFERPDAPKAAAAARMRPGKAVNRLIHVSHCEQPHAGAEAQAHHHPVKRASKVLVFVDRQRQVLRKKSALNPFVLAQRTDSKERHIIEINDTHPSQFSFIGLN